MKVFVSEHIDLECTAKSAFEFAADPGRWPLWLSFVVSADPVADAPLGVGSELRVCMGAGNKRHPETFEIVRLVRNAFLSLEGELARSRRLDFRFEQRGRTARVAVGVGYPVYGGPWRGWLDAMFRRPSLARELRLSLQRLRAAIEADMGERLEHEPIRMVEMVGA